MITLEQKIDIIMQYMVAEDADLKNTLRNKMIIALSESTTDSPLTNDELMGNIIDDLFKELGAPSHLIGYDQTVHAIRLLISNTEHARNITTRLYPDVAKTINTVPSRVERNIRHLVEVAWSRQDVKNAYRIFGNTIDPKRGKPTNAEFIACCAKEVQRRMRSAK